MNEAFWRSYLSVAVPHISQISRLERFKFWVQIVNRTDLPAVAKGKSNASIIPFSFQALFIHQSLLQY